MLLVDEVDFGLGLEKRNARMFDFEWVRADLLHVVRESDINYALRGLRSDFLHEELWLEAPHSRNLTACP